MKPAMSLSWLALTLSAVIILGLSGGVLPSELEGFAIFPVEQLESFFVASWPVPCVDSVCSGTGRAVTFHVEGERVLTEPALSLQRQTACSDRCAKPSQDC